MAKKQARKLDKVQREQILAKYAYLWQRGLDAFIWEFIRRNKKYQEFYKNRLPDIEELEKLGWHERMMSPKLRDIKEECKQFRLNYPLDPSKPANDQRFRKSPLSTFIIHKKKKVEVITTCDHPDRIVHLGDLPENEDLIIRIDPWASIPKVQSEIEKIIKEVRESSKAPDKTKPARRVREEWFDYLIAYDLKKQRYTVKAIASILLSNETDIYPEFTASKKIHKFIKQATSLIDGKYKNFLT